MSIKTALYIILGVVVLMFLGCKYDKPIEKFLKLTQGKNEQHPT